ncbi:MAG: class I SAM-dependent methyltransferase [Planctomycetes bacterium]|nr:class I SAM-dependent methyltransferase [Planctomycetota bacterium]
MYQAEAELERRHWWFRVRRELLADALAELEPRLPPVRRVLDVGCGTGATGSVIAGAGRGVIGIDAHPLPLALGRGWSGAYRARLRAGLPRLPFRDDSFDLAVALDVLEHVRDDHASAAELRRVLRPGGGLIVFVPAIELLWGAHDDIAQHHRRYTAARLKDLIVGAGFEVDRVTYFNSFLFLPIFASRLASRVLRPSGLASDAQRGGRLGPLLGGIFSLERRLLRRVDLPLGVSLALVARRPG